MSAKKQFSKIILKRTDIPGVIPTIPSGSTGAVDVLDHTLGGWLSTDIYVGEMFINSIDNKVFYRSDDGIHLFYYSGMTSTFITLDDVPLSYAGYGGYTLIVNSGETGLEFATAAPTSFIDLTDTPNSYNTYSGYTLVVNSGETGLEYYKYYDSFLSLPDTPDSYVGKSLDFVRCNSAETALEFVAISLENIMTTNTDQDVSGIKNFQTGFTFNSYYINEISNDSGLTDASQIAIPTEYAVKNYIDNISAVSGLTNLVYTNTTQTITGAKTFDATITLNGNTNNALTSYIYLGDVSTDGSYRMFINPADGYLTFERRESGVWNFRATL